MNGLCIHPVMFRHNTQIKNSSAAQNTAQPMKTAIHALCFGDLIRIPSIVDRDILTGAELTSQLITQINIYLSIGQNDRFEPSGERRIKLFGLFPNDE